ncbi:MAG: hypothetical protein F4Z18_13530 [Caldilineaceae bacterium SB0666_bin_21]|nr:hypothetical protein [Caldilineaceae bacterium SB0666_bin_21]
MSETASMPHSLDDIAPESHEATIGAATVLGTRLNRIRSPRSIAELQLPAADCDWLQRWAATLGKAVAKQARQAVVPPGCDFTRQHAFGLVFMAFAAETARREASEGVVWPHIRKRLSTEAESALFVQGQPVAAVKHALEAACRYWRLRHAFDAEEQQAAWYRSIYLQFGFTQRSIGSNLTVWLAQGASRPAAVLSLLHDPRLRCPDFEVLWRTLRDLRRRNLSDAKARQVLSDNPWVLGAWNESLRTAATARRELGTAPDEDGTVESSLFTVPSLEWHGSQPRFRVELVNLADAVGDLEPGAYRIRIGKTVAEFTVDLYGTLNGKQQALLSIWPAKPIASLEQRTTSSWAVVASEEIVLWEPADEVAVFAEGLRLDAWQARLHRDRTYDLIAAPGLVVRPPHASVQGGQDGATALHLEADWPDTLAVHFEGDADPLWVPFIDDKPRPQRLPLLGRASPAVVDLGIEPVLRFSNVAKPVAAAWASGQRVPFTQDGDVVELTAPVPFAESVQVRLRGTDGTLWVGRVDVERLGAQHLGPDGWNPFPVDALDIRDCGRRLRVFDHRMAEPVLRLGDRIVGPCGRHGRGVILFDAWGVELVCGDGRFNRDPDLEMTLVREVTEHGVVQDLEQAGEGGCLVLRYALPHVSGVQVYAVSLDGRTERIIPQPVDERHWALDAFPECAVLIVDRKDVIGSLWLEPPDLVHPDSIASVLMLLRDGCAPLLNREFRRCARNLLDDHPAAALWWLFGLTEGQALDIHPPDADGFAHVARNLLLEWSPDIRSRDFMAASLDQGTGETWDKLALAAMRFPLPVARLVRSADNAAARSEIAKRVGWQAVAGGETLEFMGRQLGVHPNFLATLGDLACDYALGTGTLFSVQEENLLTAMNLSAEYRRWLAGRLLTGT